MSGRGEKGSASRVCRGATAVRFPAKSLKRPPLLREAAGAVSHQLLPEAHSAPTVSNEIDAEYSAAFVSIAMRLPPFARYIAFCGSYNGMSKVFCNEN